VLNKYGVMEGSQLTVQVVEAEGLQRGKDPFEPYVILAIEGQKIETTQATTNVTRPVWREFFTFEIESGQTPLNIYLANKDTYGTNDILGKCEISL